jgi:hypothetical protein
LFQNRIHLRPLVGEVSRLADVVRQVVEFELLELRQRFGKSSAMILDRSDELPSGVMRAKVAVQIPEMVSLGQRFARSGTEVVQKTDAVNRPTAVRLWDFLSCSVQRGRIHVRRDC